MKTFRILSVLLIVGLILSGCKIAKDAGHEHDRLVELYYNSVTAQSTYGACIDSTVMKLNLLNSTYSAYLDNDNERVKAWRVTVAERQASFDETREAFTNADGDLNKMVEEGATPADLANGLTLMVNSYAPTEAGLEALPTTVVERMMDEQSEAANMIFSCVLDWNNAAREYNVERNRINGLSDSGKIIGAAANAIGLSELPRELPTYQSNSSSQPIPDFSGGDN